MIRGLHNFLCGHPSDKELALLATGDLPERRQARVDQHFAACAKCRGRRGRFEEKFRQVAVYQAQQAGMEKLHSRALRVRLVAQLNQMADAAPEARLLPSGKSRNNWSALLPSRLIPTIGLVLAVVFVAYLLLSMLQAKPDITSTALLLRAKASDAGATRSAMPGVIRQTVRITTHERIVKHTIYRDAQGKRRPRREQLAAVEEELRWRLAEAYVAWDAPLSAASYQDWHDRQRSCHDQIEQADGNLLILRTSTPNGAVTAQSLTVRETDFHPVRRTVSFQNSETVEIAELDYSVLPWMPATRNLFQEQLHAIGMKSPQPAIARLMPPLLTDEQLDEAELNARLALNRLHADTGEQIEVLRGPHGIEIHGITDTEERKHALQAELKMLPHVTAVLSSVEELNAKPSQSDDLSTGKVIEMQTQASPLEAYYLAHGRDVVPIGDLAQQLFNTAFAINLESREIDDLQRRFSHDEAISTMASATLTDLLFTHKHKLLAALETEEQLLADASIKAAASKRGTSADATDMPLTTLSEQNLELTKELALGKGGSGRSAEAIAAELDASISMLQLRTHEVQVAPPSSTALNKRK